MIKLNSSNFILLTFKLFPITLTLNNNTRSKNNSLHVRNQAVFRYFLFYVLFSFVSSALFFIRLDLFIRTAFLSLSCSKAERKLKIIIELNIFLCLGFSQFFLCDVRMKKVREVRRKALSF